MSNFKYLKNRPNGRAVGVTKSTKKNVELKINGTIYKKYFIKVGQTSKNVMLGILKYMDDDMNTISVSGDTLKSLVEHTGYNEQVIRNHLRTLYPMLEKTNVRTEYIVNPTFATKGNEDKIWEIYKKIEDAFQERRINDSINT